MQGETILCISPRAWNSIWRDTQQIMSRLAKHNRILFFEPGRDPDKPASSEILRNWRHLFSFGAHEPHKNVIVIPGPPRLPYMRQKLSSLVLRVTVPWMSKMNAKIMIRHVRRAMQALSVEAPILWLYGGGPEMVGKLNEKLACYYNYDEFADFLHNSRIKEWVRRSDYGLSSVADVVFATSRAQWERRKAVNPNTFFIPNGVDFGLFNRSLDADLPIPSDITDLPHPIIGFVGWLGYQIDVELLQRVANAYPTCSLVLVGPNDIPTSESLRKLQATPNVFFLGRRELHQLPNYLQTFDVALMPYLMVGHVLSIYPLKLHEYLAAGRSIVAVNLPELQPYKNVVRIAQTHDEFIDHIRDALGDNTPQAIEARVAVARENTWDHRVAEINRVLEQHLSVKSKELAA